MEVLMQEPSKREAVLVTGPPGVGKTPIREAVVEVGYFGYDFSEAIKWASEKSPHIAGQVESRRRQGKLVADDLAVLIFDMYHHEVVPQDVSFIVTGLPRTDVQAEVVHHALCGRGYVITTVFADAPDLICKRRVNFRRKQAEQAHRADPRNDTKPRYDDLEVVHASRLKDYRDHERTLRDAVARLSRPLVDRVIHIPTVGRIDAVKTDAANQIFALETITR
jgi:adenylate kinase family enzyme